MSDYTNPDEMGLEAIREEYSELRERSVSGSATEPEWNRIGELWNELRERTEVEQPECPACGARDWGFSDHIECSRCGTAPAPDAQNLRDEIQSAWEQMMHADPEETEDDDV